MLRLLVCLSKELAVLSTVCFIRGTCLVHGQLHFSAERLYVK